MRELLHSFCSGSLLFVPVLFRLLSFVSLRSWACLHRLLLGSVVTVVFVGVARDEPSGNTQMAHSQIVVVIAFSLTFEMDVALVLHGRPLGNVGFHCHVSIAVYHHLFGLSSFCFCLFLIWLRIFFCLATICCVFCLQMVFICLRLLFLF